MNSGEIRFDDSGLVPVIVQDQDTREVLTLAYMNAESLQRTIESGETWFWSRSRNSLWHKGETSGHTQQVISINLDCDGDALTVLVEPRGPACHTGARSCFHNLLLENEAGANAHQNLGALLRDLYAVVSSRREEMPNGSYTTYLFREGLDKILKKIGEEASETIIAAKNDDRSELIRETSDLFYHLIVMLVARGVKLEDIGGELQSRTKKS